MKRPLKEINFNLKSFTTKIAGSLKDARKWENKNAENIANHTKKWEEHHYKEKELTDRIEDAIISLKSLKDRYYYTSDKEFHLS